MKEGFEMKNWKVLGFVLMFVFGIVFFACNGNGSAGVYAQSSNNEQRLLGTWVNINDNSTIVFNSDDTVTWGDSNYKYGVAGNKLVMDNSGGTYGYGYTYEFFISNDGRTLILIANSNNGIGHAFRRST